MNSGLLDFKDMTALDSNRSWAWIDGKCLPLEDAKISPFECGFQFGMSLFETVLCIDGHAIALERHLSRLLSSCEALFLEKPKGDSLKNISEILLEQWSSCRRTVTSQQFAKLKLFVSATVRSSDPNRPDSSRVLGFIETISPETVGSCEPIRVRLIPESRSRRLVSYKTVNYWSSFLEVREARAMGYDDVLFCDHLGNSLESHTSSLVWTEKASPGILCFTNQDSGVLPSVTIARLQDHWAQLGGELRMCEFQKERMQTLDFSAALVSSIQMARPIFALGENTGHHEDSMLFAAHLNDLLRRDWPC